MSDRLTVRLISRLARASAHKRAYAPAETSTRQGTPPAGVRPGGQDGQRPHVGIGAPRRMREIPPKIEDS